MIEKINPKREPILQGTADMINKLNEIIDFLSRQEKGFWKCKHGVVGTEGTSCPECRDEEWPKNRDKYYYLTAAGGINTNTWIDDYVDNGYKTFLGIFRTQEEAEKRRDQIREFVKSLNDSK